MRRDAIGLVLAGVAALVAIGATGWAAIGPDLTKACPTPALRPIGAGWRVAESRIGNMSGPGDVRGSHVAWERAGTPDAPRRRVTVILVKSVEGDWGTPLSVRGRPDRTASIDWPEAGSIDVQWDEGGLGCTIYSVNLSGPGVTEDETLRAVPASLIS